MPDLRSQASSLSSRPANPWCRRMIDPFWLGMATALPVYWFLDHVLIPFVVDELRMTRVRVRGR